MTARRLLVLTSATALAVPLAMVGVSGTAGAETCHPFTTPASFAGEVPTAKDVLGFELGNRDVTVAESDTYLAAVDEASDRVQAHTLATSHQGRALRYALVGDPTDVDAAVAAAGVLRDPSTTKAEADSLAASAPAILWVAGNVHGGEESGTDASLRVLYELADRTDCAATTITDNTVVAILPTQNPDGRELDTRRNLYGFDMNRDWFARTQPETDGKLEALREYPPVLFIDAHEMGREDFFFPPNADPIYHEITDESVDWINNLYGASMQDEFDRQGIPYFNYSVYDMFYMGYGDTVPTTGFLGAGMTFEKHSGDSTKKRVYEQYVAIWTSLSAAAADKVDVLSDWASSYREAYAQGQAGFLEPNEVVQPDNDVQSKVPDLTIRHYFLRNDDPAKTDEVQSLVRRLQRMDVDVRQLTEPLAVPDYTPYGRSAGATTLPAGTFWVPMAQAQKHWVQAMLNEDTYTPFPYFYDVTAWSQPLLFNVDGGRSGAVLDPEWQPAPEFDQPELQLPDEPLSVGVWQLSGSTTAVESSGWLRWLLKEKWGLAFRDLTTKDIKSGELGSVDVLVVPDGSASAGEKELGGAGVRTVRDWVAAGGRFVGLSGGATFAGRIGLTTATLSLPTSDIPGSLVRASVDTASPLAAGVGDEVWSFVEYDPVLEASDPATVAVRYPDAAPDFFVSGYAEGEEELQGTAAVTDEAYRDGRVVLFASDPNFRAFTDGTQQVLWNALLGPDPAALAAGTARQRSAAVAAAAEVPDLGGALLVTVRPAAAGRAERLLATYGLDATRTAVSGGTRLTVTGFGTADRNPVTKDLVRALQRLGDAVEAVRLP
jgi:hypothetical protein